MIIIEILGLIFVCFALSRAVLRYKDRSIKLVELIFWSVIWLLVIVLLLFPDIFVTASKIIGISRGVDLFMYPGIVLVFYLMFRLYVKIEEQQREITKIVQKLAIERSEKENQQGKTKTRDNK